MANISDFVLNFVLMKCCRNVFLSKNKQVDVEVVLFYMQELITGILQHSLVDHNKSFLPFESLKRKTGKHLRLFLKA